MGLTTILTEIVAPMIVSLVKAALKAGESVGLDAATLRAAVVAELRSQADAIEAEVADVEKLIDAAEARDRAGV